MSFIAGLVSCSASPLPEGHRAAFLSALPTADTSPFTYANPRALISQVDLGVHFEPGHFEDDTGVGVLAGHPLFPPELLHDAPGGCRGASAMLRASAAAKRSLAAASNGNWAGAFYRRQTGELTLTGDRLATRPLYWWSDGEVAAFASTIAFLERLPFVAVDVDLQGLLERVSLGYSLADRTPYRGVRRLLAGEMVLLEGGRQERGRYWNWAELAECGDLGPLPQATLESLQAAVARRHDGRHRALTLLSGGLDSRVLNLLLHERGARIHSFNFSPLGSQDAELGRMFAEVIGTTHYGAPRSDWSILGLMTEASREARRTVSSQAEFGAVWLGAGGSTCSGWALPTPSIMQSMRSGDTLSAVRQHLHSDAGHLIASDLTAPARRWFTGRLESAMVEEIEKYPSTMDPGRKFFLFIVENNQRRSLDTPLEDILTHRQDVWTPFFDGSFLTQALAVPVDAGLGHAFYDRWFQLLSPTVRAVPWQTYPGHLPCPLPIPESLTYQWGLAASPREPRSKVLSAWAGLLGNPGFPGPVFRRSVLLARACLHTAGVRDESGSLKTGAMFKRFWKQARRPTVPW